MPLMSAELYDALLEAGASEAKARQAAEAVAGDDQRFARLESTIETARVHLDGKIDTLRAELHGELAWLKSMLGTVLVVLLGTVLVVLLGVVWKVITL